MQTSHKLGLRYNRSNIHFIYTPHAGSWPSLVSDTEGMLLLLQCSIRYSPAPSQRPPGSVPKPVHIPQNYLCQHVYAKRKNINIAQKFPHSTIRIQNNLLDTALGKIKSDVFSQGNKHLITPFTGRLQSV